MRHLARRLKSLVGQPNAGLLELCWLLAAALVPLALNPFGSNAFELPKVLLLRALALVIAVLLVAELGNLRRRHSARSLLALGGPALALSSIFAIATFASVDPRASLWGSTERQQGLLTLLSYVVLFSGTVFGMRSTAQRDRLLRVIVWASFPVTVYGLLQALRLDPLVWRTDSASPVLSTLGRSNAFGTYLTLLIPLTTTRLFVSTRRWPLATLLTTQIMCLALTQARAAWLGLVVAGITWMLLVGGGSLRRPHRTPASIVAVCAVILILIMTTFAAAPSLRPLPEQGSVAARLSIWQAALPLAAARPLFGYGPETLESVFARVYPPQLVYYQGRQVSVDRAHNLWLDSALSYGIAGVCAWLLLLLFAAHSASRQRPRVTGLSARALWAAPLAASAGHLADLQFSFDTTGTAVIFWLLLALVFARNEEAEPLVQKTGQALPRIAWAPIALLVSLLIGLGCLRPLWADVNSAAASDPAQPVALRLSYGERAVQLWPLEPAYHARLSWLCFEAGYWAAADAEISSAIMLEPHSARQWATRGDLNARWASHAPDRYAAAEQAYRRALELAPNIAAYHAALGWTLVQEGRTGEAATEVERAVALDATDAGAFRLLSQIYLRQGRSLEAKQAALEAERWSLP